MPIARPDDINVTSQKLSGMPQLLGTITATTTKNNHDTAVPFNDPTDRFDGTGLQARFLLLQPDADCRVNFGSVNTTTATTSSLFIAQNDYLIVNLAQGFSWIACLSASGTCNLRVYELL